ncbi:MAG: diacylglycerol/lipid kinase family protein [Bryobacteraceae bacterium]
MVGLDPFQAKRAAVIYNPIARGLARRQHLLQRSIALLARQGTEANLIATTGPGSASAQARRAIESGCDLIIVAGGDGTINETANGMLHSSVPLAILPGGTANVLAREIGLPLHLERAAAEIPKLRSCPIAAGAIRGTSSGDRCFLCMAGAGLDADIVYRLNLDLKAAAGKLAYYIAGFGHLFRSVPEFEVIVDGKRFEASFALMSRVRNYGGDLEIARRASLLRDDFEVVLFRGTLSMRYLPYLAGVILRTAHRMKGCTMLRARSVTCQEPSGRQVFVQIDGELAGKLPVTTEIIPDALSLLLPEKFLLRERSFVAIPVERPEWTISPTR